MTISISAEQYEAWQAAAEFVLAVDELPSQSLTGEELRAVANKLRALRAGTATPSIDAKATARGNVMRLLQSVAFYANRALHSDDATKREASVLLVLTYAKSLARAAQEAGLR